MSQGLICVCFKRWDKDVCDPYEATPWRNHTWDTNYSRSLLKYILFILSIEIVILSRGIQIEGWCLPKLKPLYSKVLLLTVVRFEKLRVFLLKSSWTSSAAVELFSWTKLQLSWASSAAVELFQLSWTSWTAVEPFQLQLSFLNSSWTTTSTVNLSDHTPVELASGQLN
jgi:hypothetical protein